MWEVSGIKIERTRAGNIFFMCVHGNWRKSEFFGKTLLTRKILTGKFSGAGTAGILTHSGFRKYNWFGRPSLCFEVIAVQSGVIGKNRLCYENVTDQRHSSNFILIALKRIEHGLTTLESMFYSFQTSRKKIGGVSSIRHTAIASQQIFKIGSTSAALNSAFKS